MLEEQVIDPSGNGGRKEREREREKKRGVKAEVKLRRRVARSLPRKTRKRKSWEMMLLLLCGGLLNSSGTRDKDPIVSLPRMSMHALVGSLMEIALISLWSAVQIDSDLYIYLYLGRIRLEFSQIGTNQETHADLALQRRLDFSSMF